MKTKYLLFVILTLPSCSLVLESLSPSSSEFTYKYNDKYTGIDTLINIQGYYECNESTSVLELPYFYNIMFYQNGLVCSTSDNAINSFRKNMDNITWGTYRVTGDTIKCQFVSQDPVRTKIIITKNSYLIQSSNKLFKVIGNNHGSTYSYHPLENRIDSTNWLLKKKWFYTEEAWNKGGNR